ncbi:TetR/AcrR family transcriptional regulator [Corynebacterium mastitidis]
MQPPEQRKRKPRADVQRNHAALLHTAQEHFQQYGVDTSLEAIAKDAGVGAGTLYRHFPTREDLLAAALQHRSSELQTHQKECDQLNDPLEALEQWLLAMEKYLSAFNGLPEPLMSAAQSKDPNNPLTIPCTELITATENFLHAAQKSGNARTEVQGYDLYLSVCAIAWIRGNGAESSALQRLRSLIASGYRDQPPQAHP